VGWEWKDDAAIRVVGWSVIASGRLWTLEAVVDS